jgi:hypothetical protein
MSASKYLRLALIVEVGVSDNPGTSMAVAVSGKYVYAAEDNAGMEIYRDCKVAVFSDGFESGDTSAWSAAMP